MTARRPVPRSTWDRAPQTISVTAGGVRFGQDGIEPVRLTRRRNRVHNGVSDELERHSHRVHIHRPHPTHVVFEDFTLSIPPTCSRSARSSTLRPSARVLLYVKRRAVERNEFQTVSRQGVAINRRAMVGCRVIGNGAWSAIDRKSHRAAWPRGLPVCPKSDEQGDSTRGRFDDA